MNHLFKDKVLFYEPGISFSWHRLLRRTLVLKKKGNQAKGNRQRVLLTARIA